MDKHADFVKHLRQVFLLELSEHLAQLEVYLVQLAALQPTGYEQALTQLFRTAHTLKGASRAAQYPLIETMAGELETLLSQCSNDNVQPLQAKSKLLLQIVDVLKTISAMPQPPDNDGSSWKTLEELTRQLADMVRENPTVKKLSVKSIQVQPALPPDISIPLPAAVSNVKVRTGLLNQLLQLNNEMLSSQQRLQQQFKQLQYWQHDHHNFFHDSKNSPAQQLRLLLKQLQQEQRQLNQILLPLSERILQTGMAAFAMACDALQRAVHDLASETGKQVKLSLLGLNTEFDRAIIEALKDPLLHLVRNAIDHGIELPEQRVSNNKTASGNIVISAHLKFGGVCISICDDGRGVDLAAVKARLTDDERKLSDDELLQKILIPGFTTNSKITALSGRGVGLDIVSDTVRRLRGQLQIINQPGIGFEIQLHLPLNLSVLFALEARCAGQIFIFDVQSIQSIHRITQQQLVQLDGKWMWPTAETMLQVVSLSALLDLPLKDWPDNTRLPLIHITDGQHHLGILVDELVNEHQVAVKPLGPRFPSTRLCSGATLLTDGKIGLILHSASLIEYVQQGQAGGSHWKTTETQQAPVKKRLLVAEDSVTTRTLLKGILELEGFDITLAEDGIQAWQKLQREHFDLIVSDVEMPLMNGFELTEQVRKSTRYRHIPIILVTALKTDEDRLKGMQSGANAYIVKSHFEQSELLSTINQLL